MDRLLHFVFVLAVAMMPGSALADLVYIDFGSSSTTGNAGGVQYNDVTIDGSVGTVVAQVPLELNGGSSTTSPIFLATTTNTASGIGLEIDSINNLGTISDNGTEYNSTFPAALAGIEATALKSHFFMNRGKQIQVTLTGLNDAYTYNFVVYCASTQTGTNTNSIMTFVPVTGSGGDYTQKTLNSYQNSSSVHTWDGIASDNGTISFEIEGGSREGWLNFMSIEIVVPEPSSLALLGLSGLVFARRRR